MKDDKKLPQNVRVKAEEIKKALKRNRKDMIKRYGERADEVISKIAVKKAQDLLKDSYKHIIYNSLNEEKKEKKKSEKIKVEDFVKTALSNTSISSKELDKTIKSSRGDDFSARDMIIHHSQMLHNALQNDDIANIEKHKKALSRHGVNISELIKNFSQD
jgi:hypothetical protein